MRIIILLFLVIWFVPNKSLSPYDKPLAYVKTLAFLNLPVTSLPPCKLSIRKPLSKSQLKEGLSMPDAPPPLFQRFGYVTVHSIDH